MAQNQNAYNSVNCRACTVSVLFHFVPFLFPFRVFITCPLKTLSCSIGEGLQYTCDLYRTTLLAFLFSVQVFNYKYKANTCKYSLLNASASHLAVCTKIELLSYEIVCKLTAVILKTCAHYILLLLTN